LIPRVVALVEEDDSAGIQTSRRGIYSWRPVNRRSQGLVEAEVWDAQTCDHRAGPSMPIMPSAALVRNWPADWSKHARYYWFVTGGKIT